jgi:hypothetical protein
MTSKKNRKWKTPLIFFILERRPQKNRRRPETKNGRQPQKKGRRPQKIEDGQIIFFQIKDNQNKMEDNLKKMEDG